MVEFPRGEHVNGTPAVRAPMQSWVSIREKSRLLASSTSGHANPFGMVGAPIVLPRLIDVLLVVMAAEIVVSKKLTCTKLAMTRYLFMPVRSGTTTP